MNRTTVNKQDAFHDELVLGCRRMICSGFFVATGASSSTCPIVALPVMGAVQIRMSLVATSALGSESRPSKNVLPRLGDTVDSLRETRLLLSFCGLVLDLVCLDGRQSTASLVCSSGSTTYGCCKASCCLLMQK